MTAQRLTTGPVVRGVATAVALALIIVPIAIVVVTAFSPLDYFEFLFLLNAEFHVLLPHLLFLPTIFSNSSCAGS